MILEPQEKSDKRNILPFLILAGLILLNLFAWITVYDLNQPQPFEVVFFDVGQGDAALIKTHLGHYILIDGGETSVILDKLRKEIPFYRNEIDLIILSHAHSDHLGGLMHVLESYDTPNILWNGVGGESALSKRWERELEEGGYNVKIARAGQRIKSEDFFIDILYPLENIEKESFNDLNLSSIVNRVVYKDKSFLFTGDAYKSNEIELVEMENFCKNEKKEGLCRIMALQSDVIKIGHHGSKTSTSEEFIQAVMPSVAIISSGEDNRYGHPHSETLEILEKHDIKILRTDVEKDIRIKINND